MFVIIYLIDDKILKENRVMFLGTRYKIHQSRYLACFILRYRKLASNVKDLACCRVSYNEKESVLPPSRHQQRDKTC